MSSAVFGAVGVGVVWGWLTAMAWFAARRRPVSPLAVVALLPLALAWAFGGTPALVGCLLAMIGGFAGHAGVRWGVAARGR